MLAVAVLERLSARWPPVRWPLLPLLPLSSGVCVPLLPGAPASSVSIPGWFAGSQVDDGEFLCFLRRGDFAVVGLLYLLEPAVLLEQFCCTIILVRERGDQVCWDTVLESNGPGSIPLSGVAPLYDGFLPGLNGGQLKRVNLPLLGLERWFLSLVRLESVGSSGGWRVCLVGSTESLGLAESLVLALLSRLHKEVPTSSREGV